MSGAIWLIVEDKSDADVVKALLKARYIDVRVEPLAPKSNVGGIFRLADNVELLIQSAVIRKASNDCIAVLHDADQHTQTEREPYERIRQTCEKYRGEAVLVIAHDEIEAWLLSDAGLCHWLKIKPKPWDGRSRPSDELKRLVQKNRKPMKYQGPDRAKVLAHLDGSGDRHSPSLREALKHLENASCVT